LRQQVPDHSRFCVVNSSTFEKQRNFALPKAVELLEQPEFDNAKPTVVYMHGFVETMEVESIRVITEAYLSRADHSESLNSFFIAAEFSNAFRFYF
jgi:hypothetical protein